jgi:hypothetical protein
MTFPGSDIEKRAYWKFELAYLIGFSSSSLRRYLIVIEPELKARFAQYERRSKKLPPVLVELVLRNMGVI